MNKYLILLIVLVTLVSIFFTYKKIVLEKDFPVYLHIPCSEEDTKCFVLEEEKYYKLYRNGKNFDNCLKTEGCDPYICDQEEKYCEKIICSEDTLEDEEICSE